MSTAMDMDEGGHGSSVQVILGEPSSMPHMSYMELKQLLGIDSRCAAG